jgi:hypothetical protein
MGDFLKKAELILSLVGTKVKPVGSPAKAIRGHPRNPTATDRRFK